MAAIRLAFSISIFPSLATVLMAVCTPLSHAVTIESADDLAICEKHFGEDVVTVTQPGRDGGTQALTCDRNGQRHGPYTSFFVDKSIRSRGQMCEDEMCGEWTRHYPGGALESRGSWKHGVPHGPWVRYDRKGKKREEGMIDSGRRVCGYRTWDSEGVLQILEGDGCLAVEQAPAMEFEAGVRFSRLRFTDKLADYSVEFPSRAGWSFQVSLRGPLEGSERISWVAGFSGEKQNYDAGSDGRPLVQSENDLASLHAGVRVRWSSRFQSGFYGVIGQSRIPMGQGDGNIHLQKYSIPRLAADARARLLERDSWGLRGGLRLERVFGKAAGAFTIDGGWNAQAELLLSLSAGPFQWRTGPVFAGETLGTSFSSQNRLSVGWKILGEVRW